MFLRASLNLEQLCGSEFEAEADVIDELEALRAPKSLLETLEQMYRRVQKYKPKAKQITNTVFGWLLVSERQLSNPELLDIIRLTVNDYRAEADPDLLRFIFDYKGHRFIAWLREMLSVLDEQLKRDDVLGNRTLLRHFSHLESLEAKQQPAIFVASVYGISIILERLERENTKVDWSEKNVYGTSGLYLSALRGQDDVVKYLLSRGVDPNVVGGRFKTPIQGAAIRGRLSTVEILLKSGADPLLEGRYPTALHAAISGGHEPVIQLLVGSGSCHQAANLGSLVQAGFYFGRHNAVMSLLHQYFDNEVNSKKFQDESNVGIDIALQAALYGNKNTHKNKTRILELLEKISDINEPGGLFGNALQAASFGGSAVWVRMVLERGADPNSIGYCGSALRAASLGGHNSVVLLLIE
ncbi:Ankyrin repeat and SAM domain-containing protein 1A [Colletotrichum siamense]|uniref:Ankyrin repeat and SAM domain-containing protein 1A n=1 Tax=Colletotrichum siamense TaxID=690259 RepID=UPI0018723FA3|nr:Ankyrin repeat and SAM domain-containing protein 1A [Colletotrichum siamense]KAF5500291.1 Ankyrin repeat and SAM domain-containing protein 1A [Colletotrichum siamense]